MRGRNAKGRNPGSVLSDVAGSSIQWPRNLVLVALLGFITIFTAFHEGYLGVFSPVLWLLLLVGLAASVWLAFRATTKRLVALVMAIFFIEYVKESIGLRSGLWIYHGGASVYVFGVWAWVLAGLTVYTISTQFVVRLVRTARVSLPTWANVVATLVIACLIPVTLGEYWDEADGWFFALYAVLAIAGMLSSARMCFPTFASLVVTAWIVGYPSEYAGSVSSRVWTFTHDPHGPPAFLLLGGWPLEILGQYALSAVLAREPLDATRACAQGGAR